MRPYKKNCSHSEEGALEHLILSSSVTAMAPSGAPASIKHKFFQASAQTIWPGSGDNQTSLCLQLQNPYLETRVHYQ